MAAKKAKQLGIAGTPQKAEWTGFANINLSDTDKQAIQNDILDGDTVLGIIADMLGAGHKISMGYDRDRDTVNVAATGQYTHCPNAGLTLTVFARDVLTALTVLAYKHDVVAKGNWQPFVKAGRPPEDFG